MPFGEIVCGSPGSGKSTYCYGKYQLLTALNRPISVVNLDPANEHIPYPCAIDISALITLRDVMDEHGLGPNGGMLYCMEYLEENYDWLEERVKELGPDAYILFDLPGQVELSTNHDSVKRIIQKLAKSGVRVSPFTVYFCDLPRGCAQLAAVHLCDAHYVTDAAKYISVLLLSLRTMLHLELPHINVLSKVDLIAQYGDLGTRITPAYPFACSRGDTDFNLDFYTEVQDLSYLENALSAASPRYAALNMAITSLIEDYGLVGFETLAVEVRIIHPSVSPYSLLIRAVGQSVDAEPVPRHRPRDGVRLCAASGIQGAAGGGGGRGREAAGGAPECVRAVLERGGGD